jgi:hypothetical protein
MRGDGEFADSVMAEIIFKIKFSGLMKFIQKHQILSKVSTFVWRTEYQQEVFHMLISSFGLTSISKTLMRWSMPDIQKNSAFFNNQGMVSNFRQLIGTYQIHHHSERCRLPNGKCRFGYP